ncbi:MAG: phosphoglycerate mutase, partial [Ruminococcaceae bacterium]|nr:phosphoglycerate mutase [Oscillospiraceae bacterium]
DAAIDAFKRGQEFVYVHVEAPDECGHRGEVENKVLSIGKIDELILSPILEYFKECGDDYAILVLPDHPTPLEIRTHSHEAVPYFLYDSRKEVSGISHFTEKNCEAVNDYNPDGSTLLSDMIVR